MCNWKWIYLDPITYILDTLKLNPSKGLTEKSEQNPSRFWQINKHSYKLNNATTKQTEFQRLSDTLSSVHHCCQLLFLLVNCLASNKIKLKLS
jgi:hypothetical protein